MVKEKKVQTLTIEEKLEQALVPDWEQPYKVPGNWLWVRIEGINTFQGTSVDPSKTPKQVYELYNVPIFETNYPEIVEGSEIGSTKQQVEKNDVLLCKINPRINRVWRVFQHTNYPLIASSEWIVIRSTATQPTYLQYCLSSQYFRELLLSNVSGVGGSLMRAQPKYVKTYQIPLPPLAEQRRIVSRIESLFEKLDHARELVQTALDSFEALKAAILHKAFTGELVGAKPSLVALGKMADEIKIGPFGTMLHAEDYVENGIPVINPKHLIQQRIYAQSGVTITVEKAHELEQYLLQENDIIMARRGAMGRTAYVTSDEAGWLCGTGSVRIRLPKDSQGSLYALILSSQETVCYLEANAKGSTMKNLNEKIVAQIPVPQFTLPEQQEIVRVLDSLLEKEQKAKKRLEPVIDQIDMMKKSILARAFRGELGTNDPSEECAIELLKEVLQQKEALSAKKIVAKRPKPLKIPVDIAKAMETSLEKDIYIIIKKNKFLPIDSIMDISSKKLNVIDALRKLEQKNIICKKNDGLYYCLR